MCHTESGASSLLTESSLLRPGLLQPADRTARKFGRMQSFKAKDLHFADASPREFRHRMVFRSVSFWRHSRRDTFAPIDISRFGFVGARKSYDLKVMTQILNLCVNCRGCQRTLSALQTQFLPLAVKGGCINTQSLRRALQARCFAQYLADVLILEFLERNISSQL